MFWQIAGFILLSVLATGTVGGVLIGRRAMGVVTEKAKIEKAKAKRELNAIEHQVRVEEHQQGLQVLALTEGDSTRKKQAEEEIANAPEVVKIHKDDVIPTYNGTEMTEAWKLRKAAEDAEFSAV